MSNHETTVTADIADAAIVWHRVTGNAGIGISTVQTGTGTFTLKQRDTAGNATPVLNEDGDPITFTASFNYVVDLLEDEVFGFGVTGASGLSAVLKLTGRFIPFEGA